MTVPYWSGAGITLHLGDCRDVLPGLPDASMDAVVTDPPYHIGFMGKEWDSARAGIAFQRETWEAVHRVLKPGGWLLAFGGTRTYHRLACAVEDAGFEIRDSLHWVYGSGFPKGKACLKPSHEPIVLARKPAPRMVPFPGLDECRVEGMAGESWNAGPGGGGFTAASYERGLGRVPPAGGRWPPNVLLTHAAGCNGDCAPGCPAAELDQQSGTGKTNIPGSRGPSGANGIYGAKAGQGKAEMPYYTDTGGAARFFPVFRYQAKAPPTERPRLPDGTTHPTVKPLALMRWLSRLVTPPGGTILDPFCGTGTTLQAAQLEGFCATGIDNDPKSAELTVRRLSQGTLEAAPVTEGCP